MSLVFLWLFKLKVATCIDSLPFTPFLVPYPALKNYCVKLVLKQDNNYNKEKDKSSIIARSYIEIPNFVIANH